MKMDVELVHSPVVGLAEEEEVDMTDWNLPLAFMKKRHTEKIEGSKALAQSWRMKDRMKTVSVALVLCLNVGVDPPDVVKTSPCAKLECWIDPLSTSPQKALETIGANLQKQYENWQPRVAAINPNHPLVQMPLPPSMKNCIQLAACEASELLPMNPDLPADLFTSCLTTPIKIALRWFCMQKGAKLVPGVTLDLIENFLPWLAVLLHGVLPHLRCSDENQDHLHPSRIPGRLNDRRTPLGELNWIFTAITDTIAWNVLPRDLFQKLFRQDLLVASLFRNFLLAERIMRSYNCTPFSSPRLPPTYMHAMWQAWDLAVDICLSQLPTIIEEGTAFRVSMTDTASV
ncbi:regulatory-associated protein of mTOR-like isoform X4 [Cyprinus carpio]|uniref:Regulatory-associated protein of mTOR-like isoform X4 n=1 Tax=Cyprinus carpio TaxID=7962 RepID=A0A9Q9ZSK2_CYPCA|nr:regulatory-associated protein of mTOR-like isoform X4 [Cyprinus carpio]